MEYCASGWPWAQRTDINSACGSISPKCCKTIEIISSGPGLRRRRRKKKNVKILSIFSLEGPFQTSLRGWKAPQPVHRRSNELQLWEMQNLRIALCLNLALKRKKENIIHLQLKVFRFAADPAPLLRVRRRRRGPARDRGALWCCWSWRRDFAPAVFGVMSILKRWENASRTVEWTRVLRIISLSSAVLGFVPGRTHQKPKTQQQYIMPVARAGVLGDAQRQLQRAPEHPWTTRIIAGTSQPKGGCQENGMLHF